ncbi:MAG: excinuclease ABC subunit UvrC [Actinomycetota bacterium]|nr:excinuclease ABC subunit UvrC [Actinomycetota bacterium]
MENRSRLAEQLKRVPASPGVYIYRDSNGRVIYVGKAKSLKNRMRSYFHNGDLSPKTRALVEKIADFEFYVTNTEVEALVLECNLIKKYRPTYNVSYRDDKSYPYIAITKQDDYPRVMITREHHRKGVKYLGPYTSVQAVRETFDTLRRIFPFRTCKRSQPGRSTGSPCLNYHIKRCLGPCVEAVSRDEYRKMIDKIELFLEGKPEPVIDQLETEMREAASNLEFEQAARFRDRLEAAKLVLQKQRIVSDTGEDFDILGISINGSIGCVNLSTVRDGKLIGSKSFVLDRGELNEDILSSFIKQNYISSTSIPPLILIPKAVEDHNLIEEALSSLRGAKVLLKVPQRGNKRELVDMASANARYALNMSLIKHSWEQEVYNLLLEDLALALGLPNLPIRIECFDISNIQGRNPAGSMVVFKYGRPLKSDYRKFKIKYNAGANDYAMMYEVISRRFDHYISKLDPSFSSKPCLIIVDGGKPQVSAALSAMKEKGFSDIPVVGLAKKEEEIYKPGLPDPIKLDRGSKSLKLMQRIRDEAHRFAISYHRSLRDKAMVESTLDKIPGVGDKRKHMLLKHFGSPAAIARASLEELKSIPGLPAIIAERVHRYYQGGM